MKTIFPLVKPSESSYQSPGRWTEGRIPVRLGGSQVGQDAVQAQVNLDLVGSHCHQETISCPWNVVQDHLAMKDGAVLL